MLRALYDYALNHNLTLPDGYVRKTVKAYISLSSKNKEYIEIIIGNDEPIPCPDIGSLANGTEKSNVLVEKRSVVIPQETTNKSTFFLNALKSLGEHDEKVKLCADALENESTVQRLREKLDAQKIKAGDRISFYIDNEPILKLKSVLPWWMEFRKQFQSGSKNESVPCLITGEKIVPISTVPPVNGLHSVGGHARGDALICFDKPAYCSYDLKQAVNAPVSESAMNAVKSALDRLLEDAPVLAGMKFVHWYDCDILNDEDPVFDLGLFGDMFDDSDEIQETEEDINRIETDAKTAADRLIESVNSGADSVPLNANYYILLLTGVSGRVMVRRFEKGRYEQLQKNVELWNRDLMLVNPAGTNFLKPCKLTARFIRLLKYQKKETKVFERLSKELSGIVAAVITAILNGSQLPDAVAVRALAYIKSELLSSEDGDDKNGQTNDNLDGMACQWLKIWLLRKNREYYPEREERLMEEYNMKHKEAAYHCGGMMAVYAAIQNTGYRDVNVNVVQRYYASAIQTPALIFGRLSQLSIHHMEKIEYKSVSDLYKELLEELNVAIGDTVPTTLDLEKQAYFALGYYQMSAKLRHDMKERIEAAKSRINETKMEE